MDGGNNTTRKLISLASFADSEPNLMEDIANVAGKDVADKIQDAWGGTRITLPIASRVTPDHALSVLVGSCRL